MKEIRRTLKVSESAIFMKNRRQELVFERRDRKGIIMSMLYASISASGESIKPFQIPLKSPALEGVGASLRLRSGRVGLPCWETETGPGLPRFGVGERMVVLGLI